MKKIQTLRSEIDGQSIYEIRTIHWVAGKVIGAEEVRWAATSVEDLRAKLQKSPVAARQYQNAISDVLDRADLTRDERRKLPLPTRLDDWRLIDTNH